MFRAQFGRGWAGDLDAAVQALALVLAFSY